NEARRRTRVRERPHDPFFDGLEHHLARAWLLLGYTDPARHCIDQTAWARDEPVAREVSTPALLARVDALEGHLRDAEIGAARTLATTVGPAEAAEYARATRADASEPVRRSLAGALGIVDAELALRCGDLDRALQAALTVPLRFEREALVASVDIASGHTDRA